MKIINESGKPRMGVMSEDHLDLLSRILQTADKGLVLSCGL